MEYLPVCVLPEFPPAHFWPSLEHLFSRCCSWQASHDIKSESLTGNQTASRPLAVAVHRLFFAVHIYTSPFLDLQLTLTWYKLLYHDPLTFLPLFFCLWPWGRGSSVRAARDLKSVYHYPGSAWRKLDSSCLSILQKCSLNSNQTFSLGYQEIYMCWSYIDTCLCNDFLCTSDLLFFVVCFTVRDFFFLNIWKGFSDTLSS